MLCQWHRESMITGSHFGEREYWQGAYASGRAAREWFLSANAAAVATAQAVCWGREPMNVLHLGCGASVLGVELCSALECRAVLNVDYSSEALAACRANQAARPGSDRQHYALWNAADGVLPPGGPWDLLVDKGTLDAVAFAGGEQLLGYFATVREALLVRRKALWVHYSDEPPEGSRGDLLRAAFPESRWRVSSTAVDEADATDAVVANQAAREASAFEFLYYRYTVGTAFSPAHAER